MPVAVPKIDYYAVLDLAHDATEDEIRVAYKKLALKWHPDRHQENKDEAQEKFVEIKDAYIHLLEEFEKQRRRKARKEKPASSAASDTSSMRAPSSAPSECASETPSTKPEPERKEMRKHKEPRKEDKPSPPADPPSDRSKTRPHSDETPKKSASNPQSTPKPTRATLKKSPRQHPDRHEHGNRRSEHDDSSDDEPTRRKKSSHAHRSPHSLEETDYEFVDLADLGTPLHPLRNPKSKESKESGSHDKDWTFPLPLTLEELYRCSSQHYRITRTLRSGKTQSVKIDIRVSPRWTTGTEVRVPGVGNERTDGTFQDIVFVVEELPHPRFTRSGDDLLLSVQVPWADSHPRPYSSSSDCTDDDNAAFSQEEEEEVYVKALDGEEYALPIPRSLVEAADGSRVVGAGMPIRKNGKRIGKGDLIIKWDFVFPDAERGQKLRWHTLKKAMHWKR